MIKSIWATINKVFSDVVNKIRHKEPWYKYYDKGGKIDYPDLTIYELLAKTVESYPNNYALQYFGRKITFRDLLVQIKRTASALLELGVKEGDRVTICMPNTPTAIYTFYAINMIGATASMVHPLSSENEIEFYLNASNSKYILTLDLVYDKVMRVIDKTSVEKVIVSSVSDDMGNFMHAMYWFVSGRKNKIEKCEKSLFYKELLNLGIYYKEFECCKRKMDDEAVILYSGGTTGSPKGILLSNRNFNALAMQCELMCQPVKAGDSVLSVLPIFHGFGLGVCIHTPLYIGMKVILVPDFSPRKFGGLIKKNRPNFIAGVPTLYEALLKTKLGKNDLSSVMCVISGGDTLIPSFKAKIDNFLKEHGSNATVRCGYGLTECTGASCLNPKSEYRDNSIGIPLPDMLYKIVKIGTEQKAGVGEDGEICINGPTVMMGYLNNPEETEKTLVKHKDGKVWLHTGDIGCMDKDGFIYFKQRLKRLIVSSGYNIYPSYVEDIICSHPLVQSCVVIGIPHEYKKQVAKAYIVLKNGEKATMNIKKQIKKHCEDNLVKYSWPCEYEYRDSLPTTLVGKVAYKKLEEENNKK